MEVFHGNSENRKYPRISFKRAVKFKVTVSDSFSGEIAQDLSAGGIRIRSHAFIPVGEQVSLGIQLKDSDQVVEVVGRVKWIRYNPHSESYQIGVEFAEDAMLFSRARIHRFINSP